MFLDIVTPKSAMAQSRSLSIVSKHQAIEDDVNEILKMIQSLLKLIVCMRKKQFGKTLAKKGLQPSNIQFLLSGSYQIDNSILKIQQLLDRCGSHLFFLQRQLLLETASSEHN